MASTVVAINEIPKPIQSSLISFDCSLISCDDACSAAWDACSAWVIWEISSCDKTTDPEDDCAQQNEEPSINMNSNISIRCHFILLPLYQSEHP